MANVCCLIEMEPRTLNEGQLTHAREIAEDIVQKYEPEEASARFIDEVKAAVETQERVAEVVVSDAGPPDLPDGCRELQVIINNGSCQCLVEAVASPLQESPCLPPAVAAAGISVKQPLSAPF